jgi:4-hydroxybenzoate polyprenyltransferase
VAIFYGLTAILALAALLGAGGAGPFALLGWLGFAAHLAWQAWRMEPTPATALMLFRSNRDAGLILFAGLALQGWLAP